MNFAAILPYLKLNSGFCLRVEFSIFVVEISSGSFSIIMLGFLDACTCASSSFPHFSCISLPRISISSLLFISIRTPALKDLKVLIPTLISPGFILVFRICLIASSVCVPVDFTVMYVFLYLGQPLRSSFSCWRWVAPRTVLVPQMVLGEFR